MSKLIPYQPLVLRLLHSIAGLLAIGALITGFWVYNTYDGRYGSIPLPLLPDIQGIHGTFGLFFLLIFPALAIYSFHWGYQRLLFPDFWARLTYQVGKPGWWVNLQRLLNTAMLLAATLAVVTGRMMQEAWLPAGELYHVWYRLHLTAWLVLVVTLLGHIAMSLKVGGVPLLLSMVQTQYRPEESPSLWIGYLREKFRERFGR
ncbi:MULTISPECIES: cytochrome b/b6 domain-containing protein [Cyanophyceae]|uniref:cytochrome b/b6 domain-containing protein n=1 Tax=Cyanophyceae TaxID=3028117 RepID=UPI001689F4A7|nr:MULTISPECIES: cytochrome b/b6 domain-containing protein [Cyanophyceae]MBD1918608.1 cytochrome b/b6 domain-containing protein [Phormidium sp. FACHB-77]MBD2031279.1 cytochrome b/b6 domain-containing protein [Phormidium sp. FACHB-322]MBD2052346.1 cytochrome b/b6 domain-containing protein [Leptolyngbya sp. FACHB-60]